MSKSREQYDQGINRLCGFLEILLQESSIPDLSQIRAELQAIPILKRISTQVSFSDIPPAESEGFFFLLQEEYERFDDPIPSTLQVYLLPNSLSELKDINKYIISSAI